MNTEHVRRVQGRGGEALGILLILFGILFFAGQWFDFDVGQYAWPFFVIVPGVLVLLAGLLSGGRDSGGLLPVGSAISAVGLILLFQSWTGLWATWAYAWALIPAAVGLGLLTHGLLHENPEGVRAGGRLLALMLGFFVVGAFFFELVIGLNGFGLRYAWAADYWPLLLVLGGLLLLARNLFSGERRG
jgi:hypothetical protein